MDAQQATQSLLTDLGFADASEEQKQDVLAKLQEMVDTELLYTLLSRLSDEQIDKIDKSLSETELGEDQRSAKMLELIRAELPDYEEIVARALEALYNRVRGDSEEVKKHLQSRDNPTSTPPTE